MESFKSLDFFGIDLTFTTFQEKKYKTAFGGILSIVSGLMIILVILFFGQDFFYRTNPNIVTQKIVPEEPYNMTLKNKNFSIVWRVEDQTGTPIKPEYEVFFPRLWYLAYRINETTNEWDTMRKITMRTRRCNETTNMENTNLRKFVGGLEAWYCIDWDGDEDLNKNEEYTLGGSWSSLFVSYLQISLYTCDPKNISNCSSQDRIIKETLDRRQYFKIIIPNYYFSADDLNEPLKTFYFSTYDTVSPYLKKINRYYFTQTKILDDVGWIFESLVEKTALSLESVDKSVDIIFPDDYSKSPNHYLSRFLIYHERSFSQFGRRFMKGQELAAVVGGFMKIVLVICRIGMSYYNEIYRTADLISATMDTQLNKPEINHSEIKVASRIQIIKSSNMPVQQKFPQSSENNLSPHLNQGENNNSFPLSNVLENLNAKEISESLKENRKKYERKFKFNALKLIQNLICGKCSSQKMKTQYQLLKYGQEILNEKLDIVTYLETLNCVNSMKSVLFNNEQNLCFKRLKPISNLMELSCQDLNKTQKEKTEIKEEKLDEIDTEIVLYFTKKIIFNQLTDIDLELYKNMEIRLQDEIKKQTNRKLI